MSTPQLHCIRGLYPAAAYPAVAPQALSCRVTQGRLAIGFPTASRVVAVSRQLHFVRCVFLS